MIAVVDYKMGNLLSVERGLRNAGADARITSDAGEIARAEAIVLPGVGAFGDAESHMRDLGQTDVIVERIREGVPFLGICLGMHLLFEGGTEHAEPGKAIPGMGLAPGVVDKMPSLDAAGSYYKIPHVGWNTIEPPAGSDFACPLFEGISPEEYFYFTHSYCAPVNGKTAAVTTHSVTFASAVQVAERAFGVQFHPEKSSDAGAAVLRNFVRLAGE